MLHTIGKFESAIAFTVNGRNKKIISEHFYIIFLYFLYFFKCVMRWSKKSCVMPYFYVFPKIASFIKRYFFPYISPHPKEKQIFSFIISVEFSENFYEWNWNCGCISSPTFGGVREHVLHKIYPRQKNPQKICYVQINFLLFNGILI